MHWAGVWEVIMDILPYIGLEGYALEWTSIALDWAMVCACLWVCESELCCGRLQ